MGPDDRDEAIAALEAVRAELRRAADARTAGAPPPGARLAGAGPGRRERLAAGAGRSGRVTRFRAIRTALLRAALVTAVAYGVWDDVGSAAHAGVVALAGTATLWLCAEVQARAGVVPEPAWRGRRRRPAAGPVDAATLLGERRFVRFAGHTAWDVHTRLRPRLREVADDLLSARRGLQLDDPAAAERIRAMVGDPTWELVRPGRPVPADRQGPGLDRDELAIVLDGMERI